MAHPMSFESCCLVAPHLSTECRFPALFQSFTVEAPVHFKEFCRLQGPCSDVLLKPDLAHSHSQSDFRQHILATILSLRHRDASRWPDPALFLAGGPFLPSLYVNLFSLRD
jgi:hypothetical protein